MKIRPIRTKPDYRAAPKEVERLCDAEPGTSDSDRVEVLVTLIEACETKQLSHPSTRSDRSHCVHDGQEGLTRRDLEPAIGSRGHVLEVLPRKTATDPADSPCLERAFANSNRCAGTTLCSALGGVVFEARDRVEA